MTYVYTDKAEARARWNEAKRREDVVKNEFREKREACVAGMLEDETLAMAMAMRREAGRDEKASEGAE